jgi:two-component system sensor histidine kinase KdpD
MKTNRTNQKVKGTIRAHLWTLLAIIAVTILGKILQPAFDVVDTALLYLLPVLVSAVLWGRGPSLLASLLGVLAFDFFFIPPFLSFTVNDVRYLFSFAVFLLVAFVTGTLATKLRDQAEKARQREKRTAALYELSRQIGAETDLRRVLQTVVKTVAEAVDAEALICMLDPVTKLLTDIASAPPLSAPLDDKEQAVAHWVLEHGQRAGKGTDTLSGADHLFVPITISDNHIGVLTLRSKTEEWVVSSDQQQLLEAFANLVAVAITRIQLAKEAERAQWLAESEKLHTALLSSISHDLRTPLASILGAVTGLLTEGGVYGPEARAALLRTVKEEAQRMNRFVGNLLDMARLESGILTLRKEWHDIQDIIGVALREMGEVLQGRPVRLDVPSGLSLVQADLALIVQVLANLLENGVKYSLPGSDILVSVRRAENALWVGVGDRSPEIAEADRDRIFDKFYRLQSSKHVSGTGLGLSICKGIMQAHGGDIWVEPRDGGGNMFLISLPVGTPPAEGLPEERIGAGDVF